MSRPSNPGMHQHDLDLMAAYAAGELGDDDAAAALVATCSVCAAEYERHREVIRLLVAAAPRIQMTEAERDELRRSVWARLQSQISPRPTPPWWRRLSYAAAALFLVVGLGTALAYLSGAQAGDTATEATAGASDTAPARLEEEQADRAAVGSAGDDSARPETASEVTTTAAGDDDDRLFARAAETTRRRLAAEDYAALESPPAELDRCLGALDLTDQVLVDQVEVAGSSYWVVAPEEYRAASPLTFIAAEGCQVAYVAG